ncbi:MAG: U32 family peptidase [Paramuribaculum sp.]|nr:U32 family peptidase [Paramuribaculum sp.]
MNPKTVKLELLAPARTKDIAFAAINNGADAIYMGASSHGARQKAGNSLADIASVIDYAHKFGVRVYVTLNTLIYQHEIKTIEKLILDLYRIETDALIIQDLGILKMDLPPIALHASTQCDIRTIKKAQFLQSLGFTRLVLPRELSFQEIKEFHREMPEIDLEAFIHGALCVSYSGACHASAVLYSRSANRGECSQICRLPFDLVDSQDNIIVRDRHLLSLKDLSRINDLELLIDAGVTSFKIEGRLKDERYVKNVVCAYRKQLDRIIEQSSGDFSASSSGKIVSNFEPDLNQSFNRGYTPYFGYSVKSDTKMASIFSPKWIGNSVGTVKEIINPKTLKIKTFDKISNGDGLVFYNLDKKAIGFRVNKIENEIITLNEKLITLPRNGQQLYRNRNTDWDNLIDRTPSTRKISVNLSLRVVDNGIVLEAIDEDNNRVELFKTLQTEKAKAPQVDKHESTLKKTGDTIFKIDQITNQASEYFIPLSILTELRRLTLDELTRLRLLTHRTEKPGSIKNNVIESAQSLKAENISNSYALALYRDKGFKDLSEAIELNLADPSAANEEPIMTCRYCIRREMGYCLKTSQGKNWPTQLYLQPSVSVNSENRWKLKLSFDCNRCRMLVFKE